MSQYKFDGLSLQELREVAIQGWINPEHFNITLNNLLGSPNDQNSDMNRLFLLEYLIKGTRKDSEISIYFNPTSRDITATTSEMQLHPRQLRNILEGIGIEQLPSNYEDPILQLNTQTDIQFEKFLPNTKETFEGFFQKLQSTGLVSSERNIILAKDIFEWSILFTLEKLGKISEISDYLNIGSFGFEDNIGDIPIEFNNRKTILIDNLFINPNYLHENIGLKERENDYLTFIQLLRIIKSDMVFKYFFDAPIVQIPKEGRYTKGEGLMIEVNFTPKSNSKFTRMSIPDFIDYFRKKPNWKRYIKV